ncbi:MAG TPA: hypothetical protein VGL14_05030 [Methylomirabilota bacterium]
MTVGLTRLIRQGNRSVMRIGTSGVTRVRTIAGGRKVSTLR